MKIGIETRTDQTRFSPAFALSQTFDHWFDTIAADTPALLEQAYRLRYQVYCRENSFENPREHPDGMEIDEFDAGSVHTLLLDRSTRTVAGTVRLIFPDWNGAGSELPIQMVTGRRQLPPGRSAEVSRFAISKAYRRQADGGTVPGDEPDLPKRLVMPCITLGLMRGIVAMSMEHGVTELYAVMKPALLRLLSSFSIYFKPFGPLVDYHGVRQPCHATLLLLLERTRRERPEVWEVITDGGKLLEARETSFANCC